MTIVNRVPTLKVTPPCPATRESKTGGTLVCRLKEGHPDHHWWIRPRALPEWNRLTESEKRQAKLRDELFFRARYGRSSQLSRVARENAEILLKREGLL
ncbi:hypothetical protein AU099_gp49 [Gordonia phage GTE8]|uniref:Uncharacterized protein n=1 Tax=Gordonia phage GTE8 TaxID=1647475 RepID=A0A0K0N6P0_9CAUD|nr:hypothetical protein AU099_gp49 [Gordonia phage GTE8]AKJ72392.1 hypothetical protein GTE8_49 [Gordonia phage GTE8]